MVTGVGDLGLDERPIEGERTRAGFQNDGRRAASGAVKVQPPPADVEKAPRGRADIDLLWRRVARRRRTGQRARTEPSLESPSTPPNGPSFKTQFHPAPTPRPPPAGLLLRREQLPQRRGVAQRH